MSDPILPLAVWQSGTNENSLPANDNALRVEAMSREVISKSTTAEPGSPSDGDVYIIPAAATGTQWSTFDEGDLAIYVSASRFTVGATGGTWHAWAPVDGIVVNVAGTLNQYAGSLGWTGIGGDSGSSKFVNVALSDMSTSLATGADKAYWVAPEAGSLVNLWCSVLTVSSSGVVRIDLNKNGGGSVLSTRPAIDPGESTSLTGTAAVISTPAFSAGDLFRFDLDDAGTGAKALQAVIEYTP